MRLCVVFAALLMGDFALARGVQAIRARVASRVAQLLQVQKVQQIVAISYLQQEKEAGLAGLYFLATNTDKDKPDRVPSKDSDGNPLDNTPDSLTETKDSDGDLVDLQEFWRRKLPWGPGPSPDGYSPSSESSDGGSPDDTNSDPITGYSRGGGGSGGGPDDTNYNPITGSSSDSSRGGSAVHWDSGRRSAVHWDS